MGRLFTKAGNSQISSSFAPWTSLPGSVTIWARCADNTTDHRVIHLTDGSSSDYAGINFRGLTGGDPISANIKGSASAVFTATPNGYTVDQWHHLGAAFVSTVDRSAYLDGTEGNSVASEPAPVGLNRAQIGRTWDGANEFEGEVSAASYWDYALTDRQMGSLAAGRNPLTMAAIPVSHLPLAGGLQDVVGGNVFVSSTTVEGGHKPMGW